MRVDVLTEPTLAFRAIESKMRESAKTSHLPVATRRALMVEGAKAMAAMLPPQTDVAVTKVRLGGVAAEKIVAGVAQGIIAALVVLPIARLIMGPIPNLTFGHVGDVMLVTLLGATAFSALGMWLGTGIAPQQIGLMFSVIVAPMMFFGCAYYPWRGLDAVPVMKYLVLANPLTYVAEGMRGSLTPELPHMPLLVSTGALLVICILFWTAGLRSFRKRAIG